MKQSNFKIGLLLLVGILLNSCNLDIQEKQYSNFDNATKNGFNGNGYIPVEFMKKSIQDIRTILNNDINEALIKFKISDTKDWNDIINSIEKCDVTFIKPKSFSIPKWWDLKTTNSKTYCYTDKNGMIFHFAIDLDSKTIYSWNN